MRFSYPSSFLKLLLLGFAVAILPLLLALINTSFQVKKLAEQSQNTVIEATQATRASHVLLEQIHIMERSARQYLVLQDSSLLQAHEQAHQEFESAIKSLSSLIITSSLKPEISNLKSKENALFAQMGNLPPDQNTAGEVLDAYVDLAKQGTAILAKNNILIDQAADRLVRITEETQSTVLWQTLVFIPVIIAVALMLALLVARPLQRMAAAIHELGEGRYDRMIKIDGPGDIKKLGAQLEWLRLQLSELDQQKQRFLRHISHELKTPLTSIREGSELLSEQVGGHLSPQQLEIALILKESSLRLQTMIEDLLKFTAAQYQSLQLNLESVNIIHLIDSVIAQYTLTIESKKISLRKKYKIDTEKSTINVDKDKIMTVFDNLISNALKYTPAGGDISIKIAKESGSIYVLISDSGPGVAPEDRPQLFSPFYRGRQVHDNLVGGTGLGLSIAREYVEAHGGKIGLVDTPGGACFRIKLPIKTL